MSGNNVCIAGVLNHTSENPENVRPVSRFGRIDRDFLLRTGIRPFSIVRFFFTGTRQTSPHIEDRIFDHECTDDARVLSFLPEDQRRPLLDRISKQSLAGIFGDSLVDNRFLFENDPGFSLGCLKVDRIRLLLHEKECDGERVSHKIRIGFLHDGKMLHLPVVDLGLHQRFCEFDAQNKLPELKSDLLSILLHSEHTYIRVGLAHPHHFHNDPEDAPGKCYVQALGIHTFPTPL